MELKDGIYPTRPVPISTSERPILFAAAVKIYREELGGDPNEREIKDLQGDEMVWTDAAKELFKKNIEKLERMHPSTPDYSVIYNHLDLMLRPAMEHLHRKQLRPQKGAAGAR